MFELTPRIKIFAFAPGAPDDKFTATPAVVKLTIIEGEARGNEQHIIIK